MKAVMLSIRPEWCNRIASGEKTIEVRKSRPKLETLFKCYIYCTKDRFKKYVGDLYSRISDNGMVIGEFICDRIEYLDMDSVGVGFWKEGQFTYIADLGWNTDLTLGEFVRYTEGRRAFGWHISDLVIYDKPRELYEFTKPGAEKIEELEESLCGYCMETDYGKATFYGTPNGPIMCEGRFCNSAYEAYLDDEGFTIHKAPQSWCYVEEVSDHA